MSRFKITEGKILLDNHPVDFPFSIAEHIITKSGLVVRVDVPAGQVLNRNIFFIDLYGEIKWQIEESPHSHANDKPFMNIWLVGREKLVASNWNGVDYFVDLKSGEIKVHSMKK